MPLEASPVVLGGQNGLEVQYWVTSGDAATMAAAFGEYSSGAGAAAMPIDEGLRGMLEQNGLRLFVIPIDQLTEVQSRLHLLGAMQRQWLGQAPSWVDIATGPVRAGGQTIGLHDGALRLGPGRLRLLLRGWTLPVPSAQVAGGEGGTGGAMDLEIVPQHQETKGTGGGGALGDLSLMPARIAPEDEGLVFTRLLARMRLRGDVAVVIVPETPGLKWEAAAAAPPAPPPALADPAADRPAAPGIGQVSRVDAARAAAAAATGTASAPATASDGPTTPSGITFAAGPQAQGPPSAALLSLGEAMLMSRTESTGAGDGAAGATRTVRAVVVLVPRVPERFHLMGR